MSVVYKRLSDGKLTVTLDATEVNSVAALGDTERLDWVNRLLPRLDQAMRGNPIYVDGLSSVPPEEIATQVTAPSIHESKALINTARREMYETLHGYMSANPSSPLVSAWTAVKPKLTEILERLVVSVSTSSVTVAPEEAPLEVNWS